MTNKEWALAYADVGWSIFPGRGKIPHFKLLMETGFKTFDSIRKENHATTKQFERERPSFKQIEEWWNKDPNADIKLMCGRISGVTVIDIDAKKENDISYDLIQNELNVITLRSITGSGKG